MQSIITAATTFEEFIKAANDARKLYKGQWFILQGVIGVRPIAIKNYNTYLQIYRIDGRNYGSGAMDMPVAKWNEELQRGWELALTKE